MPTRSARRSCSNDPDYQTAAVRSENRDALNAEIDELHRTSARSADWVERLNEAGVPCGPIYTIDQMFADPQVQASRHRARTCRTQRTQDHALVGQPIDAVAYAEQHRRARRPKLGEHTDEVLTEFGFSADEIAALREAKRDYKRRVCSDRQRHGRSATSMYTER